jgi:hypothetical protein
MRKLITALLVISLVLLVACQPTAPKVEPTAPEPVAKEPEPKPPVRAEPEVELPPVREPALGMKIDQVCEVLLPVEKFAEICGLDAESVTTSFKQSEKTCWISFTDKNQKRLTAGFTMVDWMNAEEADREFDRGLSMRRMEASKQIGTRNYGYPEVDRFNYVWVNGKFLTRIGASTDLCSKEQLLKMAQEVDGKLV